MGAPVLSANGRYAAYRFGDQIYVWDRLMESNRLVSVNSDGFPGNGPSDEPMISDDGRFIIFVSAATDLYPTSSFDSYQLFRFDQQSGTVGLLSEDSSGAGSTSDTIFPSMSENGLIAAFETLASNFEGANPNNLVDVFVVSEGNVALVSASNSAAPSTTPNNESSIHPGALSWDGRRLVFTSLASDIVPNDTNSVPDLFLHDLGSGEITLLSKASDGISANGGSDLGQISGNGRFVVFTSWATNLVSNDTNNAKDVFLLDLQADTTEMVSSTIEGIASSSSANNPAISADGRFVAYESTMALGNAPAVFLRDVVARETTFVGVMGTPQWVMSPNGKRIAYLSKDSTNSIYDRSTSTYSALPFRLISPQGFSDDGNRLLFVTGGTGTLPPFETRLMVFDFTSKESFVIATNSRSAAISPDGNYVFAETLTGPNAIVAIYNVNTGESELIYPITGASDIGINSRPLFSADNLYVTFSSRSTNVITSEESSFSEVYLYNRVSKELIQLSRGASEEHHLSSSTDPIISREGDQIYFMSSSPDLVAGDHNFAVDLFLYPVPEVDSDSDGLNDDWEMMRFGILSISTEGDEDGDGATNLSEYLAGTDPTSASSVLAVDSVEMIEGEVLITWKSVPGRRYQVQRKTFVSEDWNDIGQMVVAVSDEASTNLPYEAAETQYFYQVSLVP